MYHIIKALSQAFLCLFLFHLFYITMIDLDKLPTKAPDKLDKEKIKEETEKMHEKLIQYQRMMYAQGKYSILLILQGLDAAGKDGTVRRVFSGVNPLWCNVVWFKAPTPEELAHDFLRRIHKHAPERWMIQIFNRSHYEDILVPSVEWYLDEETIDKRYDDINNFEKLLTNNDTIIIKCYLHVSREEQKERLEERLHNPLKYRKHNDGDRESRKKWDDYRKVYHEIFKRTNTKYSPWHIIKADQNRYKAYQVTKLLIDAFENKMKLERPDLETEMFDKNGEKKK